MNIREKNRSEMYERVVTFGNTEAAKLTAIPKVGVVITELKTIQREISINNSVLNEGTKGKVVSKDSSQKEIVPIGLSIAGAIYSYAVETSNDELMIFADINSKTMLQLRDSELPLFIEKILDKADELGDDLIPFGITTEKRTAARTKLDDYILKFATLNTGKGVKTTARKNITMLFAKGDKNLLILDKLMIGFRGDDVELYNLYQAARVIIDKPGSRINNEPPVVPPTG